MHSHCTVGPEKNRGFPSNLNVADIFWYQIVKMKKSSIYTYLIYERCYDFFWLIFQIWISMSKLTQNSRLLRQYAITWQLLRFSSDVVLFDIFPSTDQNRFGQLCNSFELLYRFWSISPIMLFLKEMQNIIHDTTICSFNVLFIPQFFWKIWRHLQAGMVSIQYLQLI